MTGMPDALTNLPTDARLIVLHPNYVAQRRIFAHFMNTAATVYVRFDGKALDRTELEAQLNAELLAQQGEAGWRRVEQFVLDECDAADPSGICSFCARIVTTIR